MLSTDFYQQHLNKVSRSFAFCISQLDLPLKAWVGLTYLVCRILDTIEDAAWESEQLQKKQFRDFDRFLNQPFPWEEVKSWSQNFPASLPEGERLLVEDSYQIFSDLHSQEMAPVRSVVQQLASRMSTGMQHFAGLRQRGELRLKNLTEVNQYCFFVAGLVGEALARLVAQVEPKFRMVNQRILEAHHFGLFLQKVNLLKDQGGDEKEGRFLVHDRREVFSSLEVNLQGAFRFLHHLPLRQRNFRLFCGWSLFLGLGTLEAIEKKSRSKLGRKAAENILLEVQARIENPAALENLFLAKAAELDLEVLNWSTCPIPETVTFHATGLVPSHSPSI